MHVWAEELLSLFPSKQARVIMDSQLAVFPPAAEVSFVEGLGICGLDLPFVHGREQ